MRLVRLFIAGMLAHVAGCVVVCATPEVAAYRVRATIDREVPRGTPRHEVVAWLRANGYQHYECGVNIVGTRDDYLVDINGEAVRVEFRFDLFGRRLTGTEVSTSTASTFAPAP